MKRINCLCSVSLSSDCSLEPAANPLWWGEERGSAVVGAVVLGAVFCLESSGSVALAVVRGLEETSF